MRSFIFDFNGTLYQDTALHRMAWDTFLARRGIALTDDDFHSYMCGPPNDAILRHFLSPDLTDAEIAEMAFEKESLYRDAVRANPAMQRLTDGAEALLTLMKERGIPFAIATGSSRDNVDFYMDVLRIDRWFDFDHIFYAEGRLPGKPDPAIYHLAMAKLGYAPGEVTVVEDALAGIESARRAGVGRIVAIDTTMGPDAFGGMPEVAAVIHDFIGFEQYL